MNNVECPVMCLIVHYQHLGWLLQYNEHATAYGLQLKCDGTRRRTGGGVKGKLANGVGSQYPSHYFGTWCIQH